MTEKELIIAKWRLLEQKRESGNKKKQKVSQHLNETNVRRKIR